jgi:hypothetical protein
MAEVLFISRIKGALKMTRKSTKPLLPAYPDPPPHGSQIVVHISVQCSNCHCTYSAQEITLALPNYCKYCGAAFTNLRTAMARLKALE